jgi:hypothetical protein
MFKTLKIVTTENQLLVPQAVCYVGSNLTFSC